MTPTSQHSNEQQAPKSRAKPGRPPTKRARAVAASDTASSSSSPASTARASVAALRGALRAAARGDAIRGSATLSALATGAPLPVDPDVDRAATSASAASEGSPTPSLTASAIAAALVAQYNSLPIPDRRKYFCPHEGCGKQFTSSGHRNRHEKSVHSGKKPFECPFPTCKASFARNDVCFFFFALVVRSP
ncbi:hypothetical protein BC828DRAFT_345503 [Blastocladiella britannica]|nr:hypothetical protein BC828DRAFT_345503 [Blastocladiella britannica]